MSRVYADRKNRLPASNCYVQSNTSVISDDY